MRTFPCRSECLSLFNNFELQTELLLRSRALFSDLIFQRCSERDNFHHVEVHFSRCLSQIEAQNRRNTDHTFATPVATNTCKNTYFRAWRCFHPRVHTLPNCYSPAICHCYLCGGWEDWPTFVRNWLGSLRTELSLTIVLNNTLNTHTWITIRTTKECPRGFRITQLL